MNAKHLADLILIAKDRPKQRMVLVNGVDGHSIEAAEQARRLGIVDVTLTGDQSQIETTCKGHEIDASHFEIVHAETPEDAALAAVRLIQEGKASLVMKGLINTDKYMRAILNKQFGLVVPGGLLTHVSLIDNPAYHKLLIVTDVAIIPFPTLAQKEIMIRYLIEVGQKLGIARPKVAMIAPTEQIIESIPACADAGQLKQMALDGHFPGGLVDGPMALDVALDKESAQIKNIQSEVAGDADCLLFPNIDSGNVFYKTNTRLCGSEQAAVVVGAKVPAVLSSRGDSAQTKLNSIVLATLMSR
ncbi:phosphate acyltransferase [Sunxiuqinia dokdonensis]|uniref:Phosphate butyryltransferase n=1 Tax=Sunxiuqinia dokdonensis TaxID=1409788 RepID=A0A0L8VB47_9BACT|nr:phosphate acyltransferase [Sunxiuqinia dokdonensis]KOH45676.1 phosphate butyryltransferase [Sunxiuqinia dokdonensis]